ncbi:MAG TPA: thioredoxin domain-containing protein [Longimicrobiales bacterium]
MANRLATETSPYLLQHADNPVDWYPWGEEAFERARAEDRPILLSVGYSACHWCHVMEHESFEDDDTARIMNERYVSVKVDREERPDVDSIYMTAVQAMTGHGGWPMTVFITPDGSPFFGGTYFPPEPRHGLPSFRQVLLAVHDAWSNRRDDVLQNAAGLRDALQQNALMRAPAAALDTSILDDAFRLLARGYDARHGGFGGAPKFPQPMTLEFLLRYHVRTGNDQPLSMLLHTLRAMARGGMYDQIAGGFHRYSVDAHWLVPHFEKMLYDNALLAQLYVRAWQTTRDTELRRVAEEILEYVRREMTSPEGAFHSAQDADSEGEEGRFYVWTAAEIDAVLGEQNGALFRRFHGVTPGGNFEGRNILHVQRDVEAAAAEQDIPPERLRSALAESRDRLYAARAQRTWPARDDKVLTAWNAMMLQAFAVAAQVLGSEAHRTVAVRNAEFILRELRPDGRLKRTWKDGTARIDAFLEDYALLADALLSLYEATFDPRWVREARSLADRMIELFHDQNEQVFYDTAVDAETLVVRPRSVEDNATPSGSSAATLMLLRLAVLAAEPRYARIAAGNLESLGGLLHRAPLAFGHLLAALDFHLAEPQEIAIVGDAGAADTRALLDVVRERYRPNTILALLDSTGADDAATVIPLLADRPMRGGRATAFVCRRFACREPVTDPAELRTQLEA